jgi:hypothetical protein
MFLNLSSNNITFGVSVFDTPSVKIVAKALTECPFIPTLRDTYNMTIVSSDTADSVIRVAIAARQVASAGVRVTSSVAQVTVTAADTALVIEALSKSIDDLISSLNAQFTTLRNITDGISRAVKPLGQ